MDCPATPANSIAAPLDGSVLLARAIALSQALQWVGLRSTEPTSEESVGYRDLLSDACGHCSGSGGQSGDLAARIPDSCWTILPLRLLCANARVQTQRRSPDRPPVLRPPIKPPDDLYIGICGVCSSDHERAASRCPRPGRGSVCQPVRNRQRFRA